MSDKRVFGCVDSGHAEPPEMNYACLLYTSDAADERSSVDLGGRRIIKKKTLCNDTGRTSSLKEKNKDDTTEHQTEKSE